MRIRLVSAALALAVVLGMTPGASAAENILPLLFRQCPNGEALRVLNAAHAGAKGYDDAFQQKGAQEIARAFYHCSLTARQARVQDWAQFYCMQNVWFSLRTPEQIRTTSRSVIFLADQLASYTKYGDIRKAAAGLRTLVAAVDQSLQYQRE